MILSDKDETVYDTSHSSGFGKVFATFNMFTDYKNTLYLCFCESIFINIVPFSTSKNFFYIITTPDYFNEILLLQQI